MELEIGWRDGELRTLPGVESFRRSWQGDEYLLRVTYHDGSEDHYTGRELAVLGGKDPDGDTADDEIHESGTLTLDDLRQHAEELEQRYEGIVWDTDPDGGNSDDE